MLTSQLRKLNEAKSALEERIAQLSEQNAKLNNKVEQYEEALKVKERQDENTNKAEEPQSFDEQLMEEVIELESQLVARNQDIKNLVEIINKLEKHIPSNMGTEVALLLKKLKTVKIQ